MSEEAKEKIRNMSQADIPIEKRRALYNSLARRIKGGGLKPGLVQKYNACLSEKKQRFKLLKEFLIDEDMPISQRKHGSKQHHYQLLV